MSSFHKLTDDELVSLYTEGCDEAFDVILSRYCLLYTSDAADEL